MAFLPLCYTSSRSFTSHPANVVNWFWLATSAYSRKNAGTGGPDRGFSPTWARRSSSRSCSWWGSSESSWASCGSSCPNGAPITILPRPRARWTIAASSSARAGKGLYRPEIQIKYTVNQTFLLYTYDIHHFDDIRRAPLLSREEALAKINRFAVGETCLAGTTQVIRVSPSSFAATSGGSGRRWWCRRPLWRSARRGWFMRRCIGANRRSAVRPLSGNFPRPSCSICRRLLTRRFPYIPDCSEITSSPGTRLAYRLPLAQSPGWTLFGLLAAAIIWNAAVSVFIIMAARSVLRGSPDWLMMLFILPFLGVGAALVAVFARQLRRTARIGPTLRGGKRSSASAGRQVSGISLPNGQSDA